MAKKIQFWMTDDEYQAIEENLVTLCNEKGCSPAEVFKSLILEKLKGGKKIERGTERGRQEPVKVTY